jgi:hypothetical protein
MDRGREQTLVFFRRSASRGCRPIHAIFVAADREMPKKKARPKGPSCSPDPPRTRRQGLVGDSAYDFHLDRVTIDMPRDGLGTKRAESILSILDMPEKLGRGVTHAFRPGKFQLHIR